jgi:hypothetical protein
LDRSLPKGTVLLPEEQDSLTDDLSTDVMAGPRAARYFRLWIINSDAPPPRDAKVLNSVMETLDERYAFRYEADFRGISVTLYALKASY